MSEVLTREQADLMALAFIEANPGDCIGIIDSDEKMAAALVFIDLQRDGFLMSSASDNGPRWYITTKGRARLAKHTPKPKDTPNDRE